MRNLRHDSSKHLLHKNSSPSTLMRFQKSPFSSPRKRNKIFSSTLSRRFHMSTLKVDLQSVLRSLSCIPLFVNLTRWNSNRCYSLRTINPIVEVFWSELHASPHIHIWIGHTHIWIYMDKTIWENALYVG